MHNIYKFEAPSSVCKDKAVHWGVSLLLRQVCMDVYIYSMKIDIKKVLHLMNENDMSVAFMQSSVCSYMAYTN